MKKKLFIIGLVFLLVAGVAYARMNAAFIGIAGVVAEGGEDYSDILLFWRAESVTLTTGDYPTSGTITITGDAAITSDAGIVGTNGLHIPNAYDRAVLTSYSPGTAVGRIGFWFEPVTSVLDYTYLFTFYIDGDNYFDVNLHNNQRVTGNYRSGGTNKYLSSPATTLSADTAYFIEVAWDLTTSDTVIIFISTEGAQDSTGTTTSSVTADPISGSPSLTFGTKGSGGSYYADNIIISSDATRDLYALRNATTSPR